MHTIKVSPKLTVAAQPELSEFPAIAQDGYALVINNRPDGEDPTQPGTEAEAEAAGQHKLAYLHLPVGGAPLTEADIRAFQNAVETASGPVLAHCRSGTRSLNVWVIGEVLDGRMLAEQVVPFGREVGIDMRGAEAWLSFQRQE